MGVENHLWRPNLEVLLEKYIFPHTAAIFLRQKSEKLRVN